MTAKEVARLIGVAEPPAVVSDVKRDFPRDLRRVSSFGDADDSSVVYALDYASLQLALRSDAGLILAPLDMASIDERVLRVRDPKYAFAVCAAEMTVPPDGPLWHPNASIDPTARLGAATKVGAGAVIEAGAVIGERCVIAANVTIYGCVTLGARCLVQAGAVLGSMGFGYVRGENGSYIRFPQQGTLVIEDDVEIGANTTIDRGALGETRIGSGTKIDNQVHIGHNCRVGRNVVMASQVGISGSCVIEDGAVLAGQVGLGDHVSIGPGVILGGASGVFPHKRVEGPGQMFMGVPAEPVKDYLKTIAKVRRLK